MKWLALPIFLCMSSPIYGSQHSKEVSNLEITFQEVHRTAIQSDLPITSLSLGTGGDVWMLGQNNLWKWNPDQGALKKIEIASGGAGKIIAYARDTAILKTKNRVYVIYDNPISIKEIFSGLNSGVAISDDGSIVIGAQLSKSVTSDLQKKTAFDYDLSGCLNFKVHRNNQVFCQKKGEILLLSSPKGKSVSILKTKSNVKEFVPFGEGIVVASDRAVWVIDRDGKLLKTIVPGQGRKIATSFFDDQLHAFLFNDKLFEINATDGSSKVSTWLPTPKSVTASDLKFKDGRIAVLLDGFPYVYQLEQKWK
jgi:hypothetical protein